jgi:hypothetical protein
MLKTMLRSEKFFREAKNFCENVLHNFSNFVQLRTSDNGFRAFQFVANWFRTRFDREMKCELPELPGIR